MMVLRFRISDLFKALILFISPEVGAAKNEWSVLWHIVPTNDLDTSEEVRGTAFADEAHDIVHGSEASSLDLLGCIGAIAGASARREGIGHSRLPFCEGRIPFYQQAGSCGIRGRKLLGIP